MGISFKGRNDLKIDRHRIVAGLIAWLIFGYIFYAFFYMFREAFRILTSVGSAAGYQSLMILSDKELLIYNLFYASLASALGYLFTMRLALQSINRGQSRKTRFFIRNTLTDQGFWTWSFLLWFGKLGALLGISYMSFSLQYDMSFVSDEPWLLFLLPVVLFLSTWPSFNRLVKGNPLKWFACSSGTFLLMSFVFSQKNFVDVDKANQNLLSENIEYVYSLDLPRSESHEGILKKSTISEVFIVLDSANDPKMLFDDINGSLNISDLDWKIRSEKDKLSVAEIDRWMPVLFVDSEIPMSYIKELRYRFRKSDLNRVMYSTGMKYSKYPPNHPSIRFSGIIRSLYPRYYPEFESFLDSAEHMDRSKYAIKLSESLMYRVNLFDSVNRIEVSLSKADLKVNGQSVNDSKLEEIVFGFLKRLSPNAVIIFNVDDDVSYGRYIEILDVFKWQTDLLRNELSWEKYDEPYEPWDRWDKVGEIRSKYPDAVVEWAKEEERLMELLE